MKYQVIIPEAINLSKVPNKKPINEPKADLKAISEFFPWRSSPIKAPRNGPIIIPKGGNKNNPNIRPIVLPQTPCFEPPNFFVPQTGII